MNAERPERTGTAPWWALGLNLVERLVHATDAVTGDRTGAYGRLDSWRTVFDQHTSAGFERRLAQAGLDESDLLTLLAEQPESLAGRTGAPAWARFVDTALAAEPANAFEPAPGSSVDTADWQDDFARVLAPLVHQAQRDLRSAAGGDSADLDCAVAGMTAQLQNRLVRLVARTFVLELNLARVAGPLTGRTPRDRFGTFVRQLSDHQNLRRLLGEYPVLGRLIGEACQQAAEASAELLTRFRADRAKIVDTIFDGLDPGKLVTIEHAAGDVHERGRSVALLRFADGRTVAYKPRPLDMYQHFADAVTWLNEVCDGLGLRTARSVQCNRYGWQEYIEPRSCCTAADVDLFYHRMGALLALLYALDGVDMHYENLIAAGDQPILVDVETLLHPVLARPVTAGQDPAADLVARSVLRVGLLPTPVVGDLGAADISGLGGDGTLGENSYPAEGVDWDGASTDTMRLARRPIKFSRAANRPRFKGTDIEPGAHRPALVRGFRAAYDAILAHRNSLLSGPLARFAADEMRVVVRPTRLYVNVLDESTHPDVLRDALDRDQIFDLLWADSLPDQLRSRLIAHEIADLWAGDIPTFRGRPDSRDLWAGSAARVPDALTETGLQAATNKIRAMGPADRDRQEWLINASFAARGSEPGHHSPSLARLPEPAPRSAPAPDFLDAARHIGDLLVASAVRGHQRANWVGMEVVEDRHWVILPAGAGLADGYSGIALFLAQLAHFTGDERHRELARSAIAPVANLIQAFAAQPELAAEVGVGGYYGLGGIAYALARLSSLLEDRRLLAAATQTVNVMAALDDDVDQSVAFGRAGGLASMLAVWQETGLDSALDLASRYADGLFTEWRATRAHNTRNEPPQHGFARGLAGIGWALSRFTTTFGGEHYRNAGRGAILRDLGTTPTGQVGWCTGIAGLALASAAAHDQPAGPDLDLLTNAIAHHGPLQEMSLCHGELGVLAALTTLARHRPTAAVEKDRRARLITAALAETGPICGTPDAVAAPGLLTGLAGIGYGLLLLGFPDRVPSVLLLEAGKPN